MACGLSRRLLLCEQPPHSTRQKTLPVKRRDGSFLRRHKSLACALRELLKRATTPSSADGVLPHPPAAFDGGAVLSAGGRHAREAQRAVRVVEGGVELGRPRAPAALNAPLDLLPRGLAGHHPWVPLGAPLLGIPMRHDGRADGGGPLLDSAADAQAHAAGEATPRAIRPPCLAFAAFGAFDVALAQRQRLVASA